MKRVIWLVLLGLLCTAPCMPQAQEAPPKDWAAFVEEIHDGLEGVNAGETFTMRVDGRVGPYPEEKRNTDTQLRVPKGKKLVIEGGVFEGLLIGSGEVTLRGIHTETYAKDHAAIRLQGHYSRKSPILLTIEADCVAIAHGEWSNSLDSTGIFANPVSVRVVNHGRLESGVGMEFTGVDYGDVSLSFENDGQILGGMGLNTNAQGGVAELTARNAGEITAEASAVFLNCSSVRERMALSFENTASGIIRSQAGTGLQISMYDGAHARDNRKIGSATLVNEGVISGRECALRLGTARVPLTVAGQGLWEGEEALVSIAIRSDHLDEAEAADDAAVEAALHAYLEASGLLKQEGFRGKTLHYETPDWGEESQAIQALLLKIGEEEK